MGDDEIVGLLVVGAAVKAPVEFVEIELLAVGPDAADRRDRALAQGDGEIGVVTIGAIAASAASAAFAAAAVLEDFFLERRRPDDLSAEARAADQAGNGGALCRCGDAEVIE